MLSEKNKRKRRVDRIEGRQFFFFDCKSALKVLKHSRLKIFSKNQLIEIAFQFFVSALL